MHKLPHPFLLPLLVGLAACGGKTTEETGDTGDIIIVDEDADGFDVDSDCDDTNADVYPDAEEICDGIDNDCDNVVDEGVTLSFYSDSDGDGYGNAENEASGCEAPSGYVDDATDCDDTNETVNPGETEVCDGSDNDCDEEIDEEQADTDGDGICDDLDAEDCDGLDNDGDGSVDEDYDLDGDGYTECGSETAEADCDDDNDEVSPGTTETLDNAVDDDCDGMIDEDFSVGDLTITELMTNPAQVSDANGEWIEIHNPTAETRYLNGLVLSSTTESGTAESHTITSDDLITLNAGEYVVLARNDEDSANGGVDVLYEYEDLVLGNGSDYIDLATGDGVSLVNIAWDDGATMPDESGASMTLDAAFTDVAEAEDTTRWCASESQWGIDTDFGTPGEENEDCSTVDLDDDGYTPADGDCDNTDADINPGALDVWYDGEDTDCDGASDYDADRDGHDAIDYAGDDCDDSDDAVSPSASESCNGEDDDCDGTTDEGCGDDTGLIGDTGELGDTGEASTGLDVDGTYTGTIEVVIDMMGIADTCSGTAEVVIDSSAAVPVTGEGACAFTGTLALLFGSMNGDLEGEFLDEDTISVDMDVSSTMGLSFSLVIDADVEDSDGDGSADLIEGSETGSSSLHGLALTYTATVSVSR